MVWGRYKQRERESSFGCLGLVKVLEKDLVCLVSLGAGVLEHGIRILELLPFKGSLQKSLALPTVLPTLVSTQR